MPNAEYHLSKDAVFEIALMPAGTTTKPTPTTVFKDLCLMDEAEIGSEESGNITFKNYCTNGEERNISTGNKGIANFANMIFVDNDDTVLMFKTARETGQEIWLTAYPLGKGADKPTRDIRIQVTKYSEKYAVSDIIKLDLGIRAVNVPVYGRTTV